MWKQAKWILRDNKENMYDMGQFSAWDSSKGNSHQAWQLEFHSWNPSSRRATPASSLWPPCVSTAHVYTHTKYKVLYKHTMKYSVLKKGDSTWTNLENKMIQNKVSHRRSDSVWLHHEESQATTEVRQSACKLPETEDIKVKSYVAWV